MAYRQPDSQYHGLSRRDNGDVIFSRQPNAGTTPAVQPTPAGPTTEHADDGEPR